MVQDTVPLLQVHVLQLSPAGKVAPEEKDMPLCTQAEDIEYRNEYRKFSRFTHGPSNWVELLFYTWTKQLSRITVLHMDQVTE